VLNDVRCTRVCVQDNSRSPNLCHWSCKAGDARLPHKGGWQRACTRTSDTSSAPCVMSNVARIPILCAAEPGSTLSPLAAIANVSTPVFKTQNQAPGCPWSSGPPGAQLSFTKIWLVLARRRRVVVQ